MYKVMRWASIVEMAAVVLFLLAIGGGFAFSAGTVPYQLCALLAQICWVTVEMSFIVIMVMLMMFFLQLWLQLLRHQEPLLQSEKKEKFPLALVLSGVACFVLFWLVVIPLMSAGRA